MADRTAQRTTAIIERRPPVAAIVQRSVASPAPSPARALQARLGNRAAQTLIARSMAASRGATDSPASVSASIPQSIQLSKHTRLPTKVSKPTDAAELEAEETARKVMRMRELPAARPTTQTSDAKGTIHRAGALSSPPPRLSAPQVNIAGGTPLPPAVRRHMEPRLGANFSQVRIHTGEPAAQQSAALSANAFTVGQHIFFGKDKFQPQSAGGQELIAHELTHTIQQGAVVQRSADTTVTQQTPPMIHRAPFGLGGGGLLNWLANKANNIPGFRMFTVVLGINPINMSAVDRSPANVLRAVVEFIPGGKLISDALESHGIFEKVGAWVDQKLKELKLVGSSIKSALDKFLSERGLSDLNPFTWDDIWESAKRIFTEPIDRIKGFVAGLAHDIVQFVRQAILLPLAKLAEGTRGYDLLKAVLGEDPISGVAVPRDAETLIGGFMKFIGQEEVWENLKKANAVARAWAWFQGAVAGLLGFVKQIPTLFSAALKSLEIADLILVPRAFAKVANVFAGFVVRFVSWAGQAVWTLLEIIFEVVSPGALVYIKKTGAALKSILKNPLPFVGNLVKAAKLGFQNFADNFFGHLKTGLIDWLTGSLEGVYIPKALSLAELGKFAISVLGISWAQIRGKIVKALGPSGETIMKGLETTFDIVVALVTGGPAAAWELIKEKLTDLKDQVVNGIVGFVTDTVVKKAIPKLISMFIPGAGFISAIISIYDTIMVFVEKISKIIQVVTAFLDSIVAIAGGNITAAANRVERILANLLSLAISFLAGFLGLGKVTDKIKEVIAKVRGAVDKAIDAAIAWIVDKAKGLFAKVKAAVVSWWKSKVSFKAGGEAHSLYFQGEEASAQLVVASAPRPVEAFLEEKATEAKGNKAKEDAIKAVRVLLKKVDKLTPTKASKEKSKEDEKLQKEIQDVMNEMGTHLVVLLADDDWGSEENPSPFDYPKRQAQAYPTFFLATGTLKKLSQSSMRATFESQGAAKGDRVYRYRPTQVQDMPDGSGQLGLGASSQIEVGKKVNYDGRDPRGSGVSDFKAKVAKFGLVASESGWDVDHVVELQIGGEDKPSNLWPLPKGENRSSGAIIKSSLIELPDKKTKKSVQDAFAEKTKKGKKGLWLLIKSTRQK